MSARVCKSRSSFILLYALSIFQSVSGRLEVHGHQRFGQFFELENFGFGNALDFGQFADSRVSDTLDGMIAGLLQFGNVGSGNPVFLQRVECLIRNSDLKMDRNGINGRTVSEMNE